MEEIMVGIPMLTNRAFRRYFYYKGFCHCFLYYLWTSSLLMHPYLFAFIDILFNNENQESYFYRKKKGRQAPCFSFSNFFFLMVAGCICLVGHVWIPSRFDSGTIEYFVIFIVNIHLGVSAILYLFHAS